MAVRESPVRAVAVRIRPQTAAEAGSRRRVAEEAAGGHKSYRLAPKKVAAVAAGAAGLTRQAAADRSCATFHSGLADIGRITVPDVPASVAAFPRTENPASRIG